VTPRQFVSRSLRYYWRTNLAVVAGVATAVSVLAGALLVGDSVRATLRGLAFQRLGATDLVVSSTGFFREALADEVAASSTLTVPVAPVVVARASVSAQAGDAGRTGEAGRTGQVAVYGVDARFWRLHGLDARVEGPADRAAFISPALARDAGLAEGDFALVRLQRPSDVPLESLHGRKDDVGHTMRVEVGRVLPPDALGEFSLQMQQGDVRALFMPLGRLQTELEVAGRVNAVLLAVGTGDVESLRDTLRERLRLDDFGLRVRPLDARHVVAIDSIAGILDPTLATASAGAARQLGLEARPVLTYLANAIRVSGREVPYSLVTAMDLTEVAPGLVATDPSGAPPIVLNEWAASDLGAVVGDEVTLDYFVWEAPGRLVTQSAGFRLAAIVPVRDADRDLAPTFPGITDSPTLDAWDPPFPLDLSRVRPVDEDYWDAHRTTPKAYVPIEVGQRLWSSKYGAMTSLQLVAADGVTLAPLAAQVERALVDAIDPSSAGVTVTDVRAGATASAAGTTNFGEYFLYFSFFLVVSALLLAALFFKLGVEQRAREVGLLRAVGLDGRAVRRLLVSEAAVLAAAGTVVGMAGAVVYGWGVITALRTFWVDAVGTTALGVHVSALSLAVGGLGGFVAAMACARLTLRSLDRVSERSLLAGDVTPGAGARRRRRASMVVALGAACAGLALVAAASAGAIADAGAFFGAGAAGLVAALAFATWIYRSPARRLLHGRTAVALARLGFRNAAIRPARSVMSMAIVASAAFILIAVDAFRREPPNPDDPRSGLGGYALFVETLLPLVHDITTPEGREALNAFDLDDVSIQPFRLRPGDDASCLNLYRPQDPRILGAPRRFIDEGRFTFQASLADTAEERANPWKLLDRTYDDGAVPVVVDANSMTYVLHLGLGDDFEIAHGGRSIRLRIVGALGDSMLQSELVMAESRFVELFPSQEGYQVLLVEAPPGEVEALASTFEAALVDFGPSVATATRRLAGFHRVENTYLTTFQTLGGLGLLLGTAGLAAVLLRNALERRRELALLGAVGYRRSHIALLLMAESASLLGGGLIAGTLSAAVAMWPALAARGGWIPLSSGALLLVSVVCAGGLLVTALAARVATASPVLAALRSE
jgi:putative ABC transport system permease protein